MRPGWLILCVVMVAQLGWAQPGSGRRRAVEYAEQGRQAMIANEYDRAANCYSLAFKNDRKNHGYLVEQARAEFLQQEYRETISLVQAHLRREKGRWEGKVTAYRLYGSSLDMMGKTSAARKIYRKGLAEFPKEGAFHLELGILEMGVENDVAALEQFERGMAIQPDFPDNYYFAARLLAGQQRYPWAILYLEQFLNLERYSPRTREGSALLMAWYQRAWTCEGTCKFRFYQSLEKGRGQQLGDAMDIVYSPEVVGQSDALSMEGLYLAYLEASELMPGRAFEAEPYYKWLVELVDKGFLEAYTYWLLQDGSPDDFARWLEENEEEFEQFEEWFSRHSFLEYTRNPVLRDPKHR